MMNTRAALGSPGFSAALRWFLLLAAFLFWPAPARSGAQSPPPFPETATITYRRIFKSSTPEFIEIKVSKSGECTYDIRRLGEEPGTQAFEVSGPLRAKIFELAAELNEFRDLDLDVHRRIADLGQKTFRYERNGEVHETSFNYTLNAMANRLMQIFEGLARQQEDLTKLQRRMRYDRLGVNEALLQFESDLNRKLIPEPERLLPVLEQIASDTRVVEIARQRARHLGERIRYAR